MIGCTCCDKPQIKQQVVISSQEKGTSLFRNKLAKGLSKYVRQQFQKNKENSMNSTNSTNNNNPNKSINSFNDNNINVAQTYNYSDHSNFKKALAFQELQINSLKQKIEEKQKEIKNKINQTQSKHEHLIRLYQQKIEQLKSFQNKLSMIQQHLQQ